MKAHDEDVADPRPRRGASKKKRPVVHVLSASEERRQQLADFVRRRRWTTVRVEAYETPAGSFVVGVYRRRTKHGRSGCLLHVDAGPGETLQEAYDRKRAFDALRVDPF